MSGGERPAPARRPGTAAVRVKRDTDHAKGAAPAPAPAAADPRGVRLSKRMAELGLCSRREADAWIERGWVRVDGRVVTELGTRIDPSARIDLSEAARRDQQLLLTILIHKPVGFVSGQAEDGYRPAWTLITPDRQWHPPGRAPAGRTAAPVPARLHGLAPAGRLDIDSTGLLVMTQDGRIAKALIGEDSAIEKEYLVRVQLPRPGGPPIETGVREAFPAAKLGLLRFGLSLDGEPLRPAVVDWQNGEQLRFVLREGKKRQIRRMCEAVGLEVTALKRVRIGRVSLGNLPAGRWRLLAADERF